MDRRISGQWYRNQWDYAARRYPVVVCDCGSRSVLMRVAGDRPVCESCLEIYKKELAVRFNEMLEMRG